MMSKAERDALGDLAKAAYDEGLCNMNGSTIKAANRALDALSASTNAAARRAGYFDTP